MVLTPKRGGYCESFPWLKHFHESWHAIKAFMFINCVGLRLINWLFRWLNLEDLEGALLQVLNHRTEWIVNMDVENPWCPIWQMIWNASQGHPGGRFSRYGRWSSSNFSRTTVCAFWKRTCPLGPPRSIETSHNFPFCVQDGSMVAIATWMPWFLRQGFASWMESLHAHLRPRPSGLMSLFRTILLFLAIQVQRDHAKNITYGPHKAVAEVSNHNEPIGRKSGIQLVRKSMDFTFNCFVLNWLTD